VRKDAKSLAQRGTPPRSCLGAQGDELAPAPAGGSAVSIELSTTQVDQVIRSASGGSRFSAMLSGLLDAREALRASLEDLDDRRLSRSLLSGLFMFASFPRDGSYLGNSEIARRLGMNSSTAHRYLATLVEVGLVERDPRTRRYRLAR
jgi:DNA-binding transcriptional ArsR family regulator